MKDIIIWVGILVVLGMIFKYLDQKLSRINYREAYQSRQLLTKREQQEYTKLKQYADARGWMICPKVRLWDLIEPKNGAGKKLTLENKIRSKHVDFVLCDEKLVAQYIIELDDSSHDRSDRKERDDFVDEVVESVGYKIIHTRAITEDLKAQLK